MDRLECPPTAQFPSDTPLRIRFAVLSSVQSRAQRPFLRAERRSDRLLGQRTSGHSAHPAGRQIESSKIGLSEADAGDGGFTVVRPRRVRRRAATHFRLLDLGKKEKKRRSMSPSRRLCVPPWKKLFGIITFRNQEARRCVCSVSDRNAEHKEQSCLNSVHSKWFHMPNLYWIVAKPC
jgi:hypothetical protein